MAGVLLTLGTLVLYPFEMDTVVTLAGNRLVATHYGIYNTLAGIGITAGNLGIGALLGLGADLDTPGLSWAVLTAVGLGCVAAMLALTRSGRLGVAGPGCHGLTRSGRGGHPPRPLPGLVGWRETGR